MYDPEYAATLLSMAHDEGLLGKADFELGFNDSFGEPLSTQAQRAFARRLVRTKGPKILVDLLLHDQVTFSAPMALALNDPLQGFIQHDFRRHPECAALRLDQDGCKKYLNHAVHLKPFLLSTLLRTLASRSDWDHILGGLIGMIDPKTDSQFYQDLSDLYDFFVACFIWDPNAALDCIRNYELRWFMLDFFVYPAMGYGRHQTSDGLTIGVGDDYTLQRLSVLI
ncbi:MAG TPA: hypothetical protein VFZ07_00435, partial [Dongiaceae bacterium]